MDGRWKINETARIIKMMKILKTLNSRYDSLEEKHPGYRFLLFAILIAAPVELLLYTTNKYAIAVTATWLFIITSVRLRCHISQQRD